MNYLIDYFVLITLVLVNGFFAMSELAVVSSRRSRLMTRARTHRGAHVAVDLFDHQAQFLSALQVGITLVGVFLGVYGGESLAPPLQAVFEQSAYLRPYSGQLATGLIVALISYGTIVFGELVPKQLALRHPEAIAAYVAIPINAFSRLLSPLVALLNVSSTVVLYLLNVQGNRDDNITEEEVNEVIAEGVEEGVIVPVERDFITNIMRLGDWPIGAIMVPREEIEWVDINSDPKAVSNKLRTTRYSMLVVADKSLDQPVGVVQAQELLRLFLEGREFSLSDALKEPVYVTANTLAVNVLNRLKNASLHIAFVVDQAGAVEGIVTPADMLKIIVGGMHSLAFGDEPQITCRDDGSWLMDGDVHIDVINDLLKIELVSADSEYRTLAGFMLSHLQRIPATGEHFHANGFRFEVVDMDGPRIDKVLVSSTPATTAA